MALINCGECGKEVSDKAAFCPGCGAPIAGELPRRSIVVDVPKSKSLAIVLALFLGGLGIHKFYLNRPGLGIIYLIFCWTYIPAIIGIFEAFFFLILSNEEFQETYGK